MAWIPSPQRLTRFAGSPARHRMQHAALLMKWAIGWLGDTQDMTLTAALEGLAYAKMLRRLARSLEGTFEAAAIAEMTHRDLTSYRGDGYTATLKSGSSRVQWRHADIINELIETATATLIAERRDIDPRLLRHIVTTSMWQLHAVGRLEWRAGDLRRHGVNADDYSLNRPGRVSIDLTGPATFLSLPAGLTTQESTRR